jgi:carboxylesterase
VRPGKRPGTGSLDDVHSPDLVHPLAAAFELHPDRTEVVLLLHGWTGSPSHLRLLADDLAAAGYGVAAPLLPGHGTTIEQMTAVGWREWVRAAAEAADDIAGSGARLHVAGLSMGGLLGILIATAFDLASLTTINAPLRIFDWRVHLSGWVHGSDRVVVQPEAERGPGFASDYDYGYRDTPVGAVADLYRLMRGARAALPKVAAPTLVIQSRADETVRHQSGSIIYDRARSPFKRLVWLDQSSHVATLDVERDRVATEIIRHVGDAVALAQ